METVLKRISCVLYNASLRRIRRILQLHNLEIKYYIALRLESEVCMYPKLNCVKS